MAENTSVPRSFVLGMMTGIGMCWLLVTVIVEFTKPPTVLIWRQGLIKSGTCLVQVDVNGVGVEVFSCEKKKWVW